MVFNATFNNISLYRGSQFKLVEETGEPWEIHRPIASLYLLQNEWVHEKTWTCLLMNFRKKNSVKCYIGLVYRYNFTWMCTWTISLCIIVKEWQIASTKINWRSYISTKLGGTCSIDGILCTDSPTNGCNTAKWQKYGYQNKQKTIRGNILFKKL